MMFSKKTLFCTLGLVALSVVSANDASAFANANNKRLLDGDDAHDEVVEDSDSHSSDEHSSSYNSSDEHADCHCDTLADGTEEVNCEDHSRTRARRFLMEDMQDDMVTNAAMDMDMDTTLCHCHGGQVYCGHDVAVHDQSSSTASETAALDSGAGTAVASLGYTAAIAGVAVAVVAHACGAL